MDTVDGDCLPSGSFKSQERDLLCSLSLRPCHAAGLEVIVRVGSRCLLGQPDLTMLALAVA